MIQGSTLKQKDARFGTIRLQRYGSKQYQTEIWAPDAGTWAGITSFTSITEAQAAFHASLERLGGEEPKPKKRI
jgi:hypothetical protein